MKHLFLFMALFAVCLLTAQADPKDIWIVDSYNSDNNSIHYGVDWRVQFWGYIHADGVHTTPSPFWDINNTNLDMIAHRENSDFHPDKWVLLHVSLGNSGATLDNQSRYEVVLYNKETGTIRYFFRRNHMEQSKTTAFGQLIINNNNTGIMSTINTDKGHIFALDQRNNNDAKNSLTKFIGDDIGGWMYADFPTAYDHIQPNQSNIFQFRAMGVTVSDVDLNFEGKIFHEHASSNKKFIDEAFEFGSQVFQYMGMGIGFRESMNKLPTQLENKNVLTSFFNHISNAISWVNSYGASTILPYLTATYGAFNYFAGKKSSTSVSISSVSATITGTITTNYGISNFTMSQPGALPSSMTVTPLYNETLGVIQMRYSPRFEKNYFRATVGPFPTDFESYRLVTLPSSWIINPESGLDDTKDPNDVKIALSFLHRGKPIFEDTSLLGGPLELLYRDSFDFKNYFVHYVTEGNQRRYYSHFLDYDVATNIVINAFAGDISELNVKIMATFPYIDKTEDDFIYLADYKPLPHIELNLNDFFPIKPIQKIRTVYNDETHTGNFFMLNST